MYLRQKDSDGTEKKTEKWYEKNKTTQNVYRNKVEAWLQHSLHDVHEKNAHKAGAVYLPTREQLDGFRWNMV